VIAAMNAATDDVGIDSVSIVKKHLGLTRKNDDTGVPGQPGGAAP
jgi:hypothetical protein